MTAALTGPLWLVGGGKMGSALAQGWLAAGLPAAALTVVEPAQEALTAALLETEGEA